MMYYADKVAAVWQPPAEFWQQAPSVSKNTVTVCADMKIVPISGTISLSPLVMDFKNVSK